MAKRKGYGSGENADDSKWNSNHAQSSPAEEATEYGAEATVDPMGQLPVAPNVKVLAQDDPRLHGEGHSSKDKF